MSRGGRVVFFWGWIGLDWVHIRCCGNGCLGFRPDGGSLLKSPEAGPVKSKQNAFAPPLGTSLRLGVPSLRHCSVGRREGPSLAQRGYPGIHAGMPTAQCLRSAIVVNGAPRSTSTARRPNSRPGSPGHTPIRTVGAKLARDGGGSVAWMLGLLASSRASFAPTGDLGCS